MNCWLITSRRGTAQKIEAFDSSFDNLDKRTQRIDIGDLNIALLPKQTRGETVTVCMKFKSGDEKNLFGKANLQPVAARDADSRNKDDDSL